MKSRIPGFLLLMAFAGPMTANAAFVVTHDSRALFSGEFSFSGAFDIDSAISTYGLLPGEGAPEFLYGTRNWSEDYTNRWSVLYTDGTGTPSNPFLLLIHFPDGSTEIQGSSSGYYDNSGVGRVYWLFSGVSDTGGADGTFAGAFCFSTTGPGCAPPPPIPLPAAAWLLLSGVGVLGVLGRRRKT
jgi:hypothetical protein